MANLLWFLLGGFIVTALYFIGGLVLCLTIVGIPFGVQLFKLGVFSIAPFGRDIGVSGFATNLLGLAMNVIWLVAGGFELATLHVVLAVIMALTVVGIPFAIQHMKMARLALMPFGSTLD